MLRIHAIDQEYNTTDSLMRAQFGRLVFRARINYNHELHPRAKSQKTQKWGLEQEIVEVIALNGSS